MKLTIYDGSTTQVVHVQTPQLLSELFFVNKTPVAMPCGGRGRCMKCRVRVHGDVSPMGDAERTALSQDEIDTGVRLACLTTLTGDAEVTLLARLQEKIVTAGALPSFPLQPLGSGLGVAVDIGTTTLAAYLYDQSKGRLLATASAVNPQGTYGADVISRLEKAHGGQAAALAGAIRIGLNGLIGRLCEASGSQREEIDAVVLTGNTAMEYLLTGQKPDSLIKMPFHEDRNFGEYISPADLDLDLPGCEAVYVTRCISAYVGGDITMSSMAAELFRRTREEGPCLLCDIGTNGEMVLLSGGKLWCCSTAAGPTFEGAGISMGMTARQGAVSRVAYTDGKFSCEVIGGGKAVGICGSGIIDAVAAMLDAGVIDETGRLCDEDHNYLQFICEKDGRTAFRLPGTEVIVTQADVRAVQLAKAAICAGMLTLLHTAGLDGQCIPLKIAGGFGSFIGVRAAERVGLIPAGYAAMATAIGNAAGAGACMTLLSREMLEASEMLSRSIDTVELATDKYFIQTYTNSMLFPEGVQDEATISGILLSV